MLRRLKDLVRSDRALGGPDDEAPHGDIPPARLRRRVHGAEDLESFEAVGSSIAAMLFDRLRGVETGEGELRALDFGVGCGRVLIPLHRLCQPPALLVPVRWRGTDIDAEAIKWLKSLPSSFGEFFVNGARPPLPFADRLFDFVYSISVFTHLPEDMQFAWLKDIHRVLKPGGTAVLTTHPFGPPRSAKEERLIARGFNHFGRQRTEGLPKFYQTACHTPEYIQREWSRFLTVESIVEKGVHDIQDLIVCRRAR